MHFKGLLLVGLMSAIAPAAFATTVEPITTGAPSFKSVVVSSSRVARGSCAHKRVKCLALNRKKTGLTLTENTQAAQQFGLGTVASSQAGVALASSAKLGGYSFSTAGLSPGSLLNPTSGGGGDQSTGGGGGDQSTGGGTPGASGGGTTTTPTDTLPAVPLPTSAYLLALALSLLLLTQRRSAAVRVKHT